METPSAALTERFSAIVGPQYALRDAADIAPYLIEPRDKFHGSTALVLRPGTVEEVAAILALANETGTAVVPQGGNTGHVGGQVPHTNAEILVSLSRLNRIRDIDTDSSALIVDAGVVLADAQAAAERAGLLFPLSLGSEGSCQIGGNLSTNAGGTAVLAYGNTRELVLGIEVVLPSGEVWNGLRTLRKDNTGYDLKDLFIGAEGTLGIITGAALKLFPRPKGISVALIGLKSPDEALALFRIARDLAGSSLTGAEIMPRIGMDTIVRYLDGGRDPIATPHPWYVLLEVSSAHSEEEARRLLEAIFAEALERGVADDGVLAQSMQQANAFWHMRHSMSELQKNLGGSIKHDVAVPLSRVPDLIARSSAAVSAMIPGIRPFPFGHIGDGNIHLNFTQPEGMDKRAFLDRWEEVNATVHAIVSELGGTISAEHGIGVLKRDLLPGVKSKVELDLMRKIKAALDPRGIMNPGKIL